MTSTYQYLTVATLESITGKDYSALSAAYTDTVIEAWITLAERIVNSILQTSFTGTIPDYVVAATALLASRIARNRIMDDGFLQEDYKEKKVKEVLIDADIYALLGAPVQNGFAARGQAGTYQNIYGRTVSR